MSEREDWSSPLVSHKARRIALELIRDVHANDDAAITAAATGLTNEERADVLVAMAAAAWTFLSTNEPNPEVLLAQVIDAQRALEARTDS